MPPSIPRLALGRWRKMCKLQYLCLRIVHIHTWQPESVFTCNLIQRMEKKFNFLKNVFSGKGRQSLHV